MLNVWKKFKVILKFFSKISKIFWKNFKNIGKILEIFWPNFLKYLGATLKKKPTKI